MSKCVHETENGICEVAKIPCEKVVICTPMTVYIDKEDEPKDESNDILK